MFRDMSRLAADWESALVEATTDYLRNALPRGEYLTAMTEQKVRRIILHASDDGRRLYERLGFVPTNEMRLE
jgi:IS30 family transposase